MVTLPAKIVHVFGFIGSISCELAKDKPVSTKLLSEETFSAIFDLHAPYVYAASIQICLNQAEADDLLESVFCQALIDSPCMLADSEMLRPALVRAALQIYCARLQREGRQTELTTVVSKVRALSHQ